jgi:hypothetical protein
MNGKPGSPAAPPKRWFQFRLKTLLIAITLLGVIGGGWLARERAKARRQADAAENLRSIGAEIYSRPNWLRSLLVPGSDGDVVGIGLRGRQKVNDLNLARLADLDQLVWIDLQQTSITDAALVHVAGLKHLERLRLDETSVTDSGMVHLASLPKLHTLNLERTGVTDAGLEQINRLPLQELYLSRAGVTRNTALLFRRSHPNANVIIGR